MELSLVIELYETSLRIFTVDSLYQCSDVDITGGYGKKSVPLYLHFQQEEDEPLIGEDALLYDVIELQFIDSIYCSSVYFVEYMSVLLKKVKNIIHEGNLTRLVFVFSEEQGYITEQDYKLIEFIEGMPVFWISRRKSVKSYYESQKLNDKRQGLYIDDRYLYISMFEENEIENYRFEFSLKTIDDFYLNLLSRYTMLEKNDYRVIKLYEGHKGLIHQGIINQKDVHVYSNLTFPPLKITIYNAEVFEFIRQWESEYSIEILSFIKKHKSSLFEFLGTGHDLPIMRNVLGKRLKEMGINDRALAIGSVYYLDTGMIEDTFNKGYFLQYKNERIDLIRAGDIFSSKYKVELVVTHDVDKLELFETTKDFSNGQSDDSIDARSDSTVELTKSINEPINSLKFSEKADIAIIDYSISFDSDQKVSEVYYEVRRI